MPRTRLHLDQALGHAATDKRLEILRRVGECGSISQAAREAGVSYKAAWQALDMLSNLAGLPLVERAVGGAGGGGARLTPAGEKLLQAGAAMARTREQVLSGLGTRREPAALAGLALRTSMRNQLRARIAALRRRAGGVDVALELSDGVLLVSRVTRESVQLLELVRGQEVLALCKAAAVEIRAADAGEGSNILGGSVIRAPRAGAAGEVSLALEGGQQLVGFARADSGLRVRSAAVALIEPSAVVIALGS